GFRYLRKRDAGLPDTLIADSNGAEPHARSHLPTRLGQEQGRQPTVVRLRNFRTQTGRKRIGHPTPHPGPRPTRRATAEPNQLTIGNGVKTCSTTSTIAIAIACSNPARSSRCRSGG